jgi:hypothetical protein
VCGPAANAGRLLARREMLIEMAEKQTRILIGSLVVRDVGIPFT